MAILRKFVSSIYALKNPEKLKAVAVVAIMVGAVLTLVSLVSAWLWTRPPYPDADRLFRFWETHASEDFRPSPVSPATFTYWSNNARSFDVAAYFPEAKTSLLEGAAGEIVEVRVAQIHGPFLEVMGTAPFMGSPPSEGSVLISFSVWQRLFGRDPQIVGKELPLRGRGRTIAGVMPDGFAFPQGIEVWFSAGELRSEMGRRQRGSRYLEIIARRHRNATEEQMAVELKALSQSLAERFADTHGGWETVHKGLHRAQTDTIRPALRALVASAALLFLLGMANFANLVSGDLLQRHRELAVRRALGAGRRQISSLVMAETTAVALVGSLAGGFLGMIALDFVGRLLPSNIPALPEETPLLWLPVGLVTLVLGASVGYFMSLVGSARLPMESLRGGRSASPAVARISSGLVVFQVALAACVLIVAGLLLRSFLALAATDPGFAVEDRYAFRFQWQLKPGQSRSELVEPMAMVMEALNEIPEIASASLVTHQPLADPLIYEEFTAQGDDSSSFRSALLITDAQYLSSLKIKTLEGRSLAPEDSADAPAVAVINRALAQRLWPGQSPLGRSLRRTLEDRERLVVGVVSDIRSELSVPAGPQVYVPYAQSPLAFGRIVLHLETPSADLQSRVKAAAGGLAPDLRLYGAVPMTELVDSALPQSRLAATTLVILGVIALILAAMGLHAVVSRAMVRRIQEMSLRQALGATPLELTLTMLGHQLKPVFAGLSLGFLAAVSTAPLLASLLYGVKALDPVTWIAVLVLLSLVAGFAVVGPIRRAVRSPIAEVLRRA